VRFGCTSCGCHAGKAAAGAGAGLGCGSHLGQAAHGASRESHPARLVSRSAADAASEAGGTGRARRSTASSGRPWWMYSEVSVGSSAARLSIYGRARASGHEAARITVER
jgi:hypothetical protein